jgi:hypothetical protein
MPANTATPGAAADAAPRDPNRLKILFIGNSFTQRHDLPGLIARLAAARGKRVEHRLVSAGGASLRMHWNAGRAVAILQDTPYDLVVLQEQSTLPGKNASRMHENVRLFDTAITAAGARTVLYMTWARQHQPEAQQAIRDAYESIGRELGATVVPVGLAWERILSGPAPLVLHDQDKSHPALAGSYLAACVFYAVLFGDTPVGIADDVAGIAESEKRVLQQAAWDTSTLR